MRLSGQKCQCSGCGEYFKSSAAFDKHRVGQSRGKPGARSCLTPEEMLRRGMERRAGWWITQAMPDGARF